MYLYFACLYSHFIYLDYFVCCVNVMADAKPLVFRAVHEPESAFRCVRNKIYKSASPSPDQFFRT
jgi:hypothetical protein